MGRGANSGVNRKVDGRQAFKTNKHSRSYGPDLNKFYIQWLINIRGESMGGGGLPPQILKKILFSCVKSLLFTQNTQNFFALPLQNRKNYGNHDWYWIFRGGSRISS
jgi:hypothetical protein